MSTKHRRDARPEETHQNSVETARKGGLVSTFHTAQKALRHLAEIKDVVRDGTRYAAEHVSIPQALEWLLDNWYIAEREGKGAADDIRRLGRLPRCGDGKTLFVLYAAHEYLEGKMTPSTPIPSRRFSTIFRRRPSSAKRNWRP